MAFAARGQPLLMSAGNRFNQSKNMDLSTVIGCRDDINLPHAGLEPDGLTIKTGTYVRLKILRRERNDNDCQLIRC